MALSSGELELHALGALSVAVELIFAQAILKENGLSFLMHARARKQHCTRSGNENKERVAR